MDKASIIQELMKRKDQLDPQKAAIVQELAKRMNISGTDKKQEDSSLSRFGQGLYQTTVGPLVDIWNHQQDNVKKYGPWLAAFVTGYDLAKGAVKGSNDQAVTALKELTKGNVGEFIQHAPGVVPFFGPAAVQASEEMEKGNVAGGLGQATGLIGMAAAPEVVKSVPGIKVLPKMVTKNPVEAAAVDYGLREGIPVDAATATGNPLVRAGQAVVERTSVPGSFISQAARKSQVDALQSTGGRLANRAYWRPTSAEGAGKAVSTKLKTNIETKATEAKAAYTDFESKANMPRNVQTVQTGTRQVNTGVLDANGNPIIQTQAITKDIALPIDMRPIKTALEPIYDEMMKTMPETRKQASPGLVAIKNVLDSDDMVSASTAEKNLGALKKDAGYDMLPGTRNRSQGMAAQAVRELQDQIDSVVGNAGPDILDALKAGRKLTREKHSAISILDDLKEEPVRAFNQATLAKDAGIEYLRELNKQAPQEMAKIGRAYLENLLTRATAEGDFGRTQGIWSSWQNLGKQTKRIIYKDPRLIEDLDNFFLLAKKIAENPNPSGTAYTAAVTAAGTMAITNPVTMAVTQISGGVLAKMLHSPKAVRALMNGMKIQVSSKLAAKAAATEILGLAGKDNALETGNLKKNSMNETQQSQKEVPNIFAQNPAKLATGIGAAYAIEKGSEAIDWVKNKKNQFVEHWTKQPEKVAETSRGSNWKERLLNSIGEAVNEAPKTAKDFLLYFGPEGGAVPGQIAERYLPKVAAKAQIKGAIGNIYKKAIEVQEWLNNARREGAPLRMVNEAKPWIEGNSEYLKSVDPDLLCQKSEGCDVAINRLKQQLGKDYDARMGWEVFARASEEGLKTPCPQCYVYWPRKGKAGTMAKKFIVGVGGYNGEIMRMPETTLKELQARGFRHFSSTDFKAEQLSGLMVEMAEASERKIPITGYTKEADFAKIFGPSGAYINMSVGRNSQIGMDMATAKRMRNTYPNVGTTYIAFTDDEIIKALRDPNIDHVIPWHSSGAKVDDMKKIVKDADVHNYTMEQNETINGLKVKEPIKEIEHKGELKKYLKLCKQKGYTPKFERIYEMLPENEKSLYMKLIGPEYGKFKAGATDIGNGKIYAPPDPTKMNTKIMKDVLERRKAQASVNMKAYTDIADQIAKEVKSGKYEPAEDIIFRSGPMPVEPEFAQRVKKAKVSASSRAK